MRIDWDTIGQQAAGAATGYLTGNLVLAGLNALGGLFGKRRRKKPEPTQPSFSMTTIMKGDQPSLTAYDLTQSIFNALQSNASTSPNTQLRNAMMIQGTQSYMQALPQIKQAAAQAEAQKAQSLMETYARGTTICARGGYTRLVSAPHRSQRGHTSRCSTVRFATVSQPHSAQRYS